MGLQIKGGLTKVHHLPGPWGLDQNPDPGAKPEESDTKWAQTFSLAPSVWHLVLRGVGQCDVDRRQVREIQ